MSVGHSRTGWGCVPWTYANWNWSCRFGAFGYVCRTRPGRLACQGVSRARQIQKGGMTMVDLFRMFPNDRVAEKWFERSIWANGRKRGRCGCSDTAPARHPSMPYRCVGCKRHFSVKIGTAMGHSKISYRHWAMATYQFAANHGGVPSMRMRRDLGITQAAAWLTAQRLRDSWRDLAGAGRTDGHAEMGEVHPAGLEKNRQCRQ